MTSIDDGASHKMSESKVMHNSDSNCSAFQAEALLDKMPFKMLYNCYIKPLSIFTVLSLAQIGIFPLKIIVSK